MHDIATLMHASQREPAHLNAHYLYQQLTTKDAVTSMAADAYGQCPPTAPPTSHLYIFVPRQQKGHSLE